MKLTAKMLRKIIKEEVEQAAMTQAAAKSGSGFDISNEELTSADAEEDINNKKWPHITIVSYSTNPRLLRTFKDMKLDDVVSRLKVGGKRVAEGDSSLGSDPRGGTILSTVLEVDRKPALIAMCSDSELTTSDMAEYSELSTSTY